MVRISLFLHEICLRQSGIFPLQRAGHAASFASLAGFADTPLADLRISGSFSAHAGSTVRDVAPATERERSRAAEDQPGSAVCVSRRNRRLCGGHGYLGGRVAGALPSAGDSTRDQMLAAADLRSNFDVPMMFSTKYEPRHSLLERWRTWQQWKTRYFGYYRDVPPAAAAQILGGRLVYMEARNGQWVGIIEMR